MSDIPACDEPDAEMIDAAYDVLNEHYLDNGVYDLTPPVLREIYLAMCAAERRRHACIPGAKLIP